MLKQNIYVWIGWKTLNSFLKKIRRMKKTPDSLRNANEAAMHTSNRVWHVLEG